MIISDFRFQILDFVALLAEMTNEKSEMTYGKCCPIFHSSFFISQFPLKPEPFLTFGIPPTA